MDGLAVIHTRANRHLESLLDKLLLFRLYRGRGCDNRLDNTLDFTLIFTLMVFFNEFPRALRLH